MRKAPKINLFGDVKMHCFNANTLCDSQECGVPTQSVISQFLLIKDNLVLKLRWKFLRMKLTPSNLYLYSKSEV